MACGGSYCVLCIHRILLSARETLNACLKVRADSEKRKAVMASKEQAKDSTSKLKSINVDSAPIPRLIESTSGKLKQTGQKPRNVEPANKALVEGSSESPSTHKCRQPDLAKVKHDQARKPRQPEHAKAKQDQAQKAKPTDPQRPKQADVRKTKQTEVSKSKLPDTKQANRVTVPVRDGKSACRSVLLLLWY